MPKLGITNSIVRNHPRRRTLSGGGSLIPASGLSLWLRADAGVTNDGDEVADGDYVTDWADQSGSGNNALGYGIGFGQGGDAPPTFVDSSINSKPAISFNDDGSWMQIPQNNIGDEGNISIFVVLNYSAGAVILNKGDAATFNATVWEITPSNGFGFVDNYDDDPSWNTVPISMPQVTPVLLEAFSSAGVSQIAYNGTNSGSPSAENGNFNSLSQYIGIGGGGTTGASTASLDARIAEIIIYNRQVTTPERQQIETYLLDKYAICLDTTSNVLMTGWSAGPRTLTPIGYAPYGNETYTYGAEVVRYETGVWIYGNSEGGGEIARAYSSAARPWLATWPAGFTAEKICL
jgi:hypothetical protein